MSSSLTRVPYLFPIYKSIISSHLFIYLAVKIKSCLKRIFPVKCKCLCFAQCKDALSTRQKLIAQDYKVSYSLAKACKPDLRKYRCNMDTSMPRAREAKLSYLLLCLEAAVHRGEALM